ncbi:MAG: metallophosphoesterase family protein [Deltaproteobacteria bacterium]|nr:metallophosphoesterase family protein [Deltaproteobacteria bacterium]
MQVGIMADSHGRPETIKSALQLFVEQGCSKVYHLGDICDSLNPGTAEACVRILSEHSVSAVKGNNEHALIVNQEMNPELPVTVQVIDYLKSLELVIQDKYAVFAHSLPFVRELGVSCMIRGLTKEAVEIFMNLFPDRVLFRGHSHAPEIIWRENDKIITRPITAGEEVNFGDRMPCLVTCGALTRGMCMIWKPERMTISCLSFN